MTNATQARNGAAVNTEDEDEDDELEGRVTTGFSCPIPMKIEIEKAAKAANLKPSDYIRGVMAKAVGYTLPASVKVRAATQTDEEKKAAQRAAAAEHRNKMKALLNQHRREAGLPVSEDE